MSVRRVDHSSFVPSPRRVTLLVPESLRAAACCLEDALVARGWRVNLLLGADARRGLARKRHDPNAGLRVLCVAEHIDTGTAIQLCRAFDPDRRGDFKIVHFTTPRRVIEALERFTAPAGSLPPRRVGRRILANPTLVELSAVRARTTRTMFAAAACLAIGIGVAGSVGGLPTTAHVRTVAIPTAASPTAWSIGENDPVQARVDEVALASARAFTDLEDDLDFDDASDEEDEIVIFDIDEPTPTKHRPASTSPMITAAPDESMTIALAAPAVVVAPTPDELASTKLYPTIDPFADPDLPADSASTEPMPEPVPEPLPEPLPEPRSEPLPEPVE